MIAITTSSNRNFTRASEVQIPEIYNRRFCTGIQDLDELFGGQGFLPGQMITLAAGAGTGKSSFLLQMMEQLERAGKRTAFISGEETIEQISFSCKRLGVGAVPLANLTDIDDIEKAVIENKIEFLVLDSYPTITTKKKMNSKQKEEYIVGRLQKLAKENEVCMALIMHYTKSGTFKGTTLLNHAVDTFMTIEKNPDDRNLRDFTIHKNRFGGGTFTTFPFGAQGYTFEAVTTDSSPERPSKKASKAEVITESLTEPKTVQQICETTGASGAYLSTLLRQLVNEGKIVKDGKGATAKYAKA